MIRNHYNQAELIDFIHPFGDKSPSSNRWMKISKIVPSDEIQSLYAKSFKKTNMANPALLKKITLGDLIVKKRQGITN